MYEVSSRSPEKFKKPTSSTCPVASWEAHTQNLQGMWNLCSIKIVAWNEVYNVEVPDFLIPPFQFDATFPSSQECVFADLADREPLLFVAKKGRLKNFKENTINI